MKDMRDGSSPRYAKPVKIEPWAIGNQHDMADFITALCLCGFEGQWVRLSAADQRALIGKAWFGKRAIKVTASTVRVWRTVCFGTDFDHIEMSQDDWRNMVSGKLLV